MTSRRQYSHDMPAADMPPPDDAFAWLIALQEAPADARLQAQFEDWRVRNADAWEEALKVSSLVIEVATDLPQALPPVRSSKTLVRYGWAAGLVAIAAALLVVLLPGLMVRLQADYITAKAAIEVVTLADGSRITLGADSAIAVDFDTAKRRVRLLSGEAFFEVARDVGRPFEVGTEDWTSTALGTAFDVRRSDSGITVSVAEGHVGAGYRGIAAAAPLGAGDWARFDWAGHTLAHGQTDPSVAGAWRQGRLIVADLPLVEVIDALRRQYRGVIWTESHEFDQIRVTGTYRLEDPVAAIRAAVYPAGGAVRQVGSWLLVISQD
jgi:transmembrane sensor